MRVYASVCAMLSLRCITHDHIPLLPLQRCRLSRSALTCCTKSCLLQEMQAVVQCSDMFNKIVKVRSKELQKWLGHSNDMWYHVQVCVAY